MYTYGTLNPYKIMRKSFKNESFLKFTKIRLLSDKYRNLPSKRPLSIQSTGAGFTCGAYPGDYGIFVYVRYVALRKYK